MNTLQKKPHRSHVVIVGGGFAGLYAAKELKDAPVNISLIDRRNYHLFQPLLYQVATAALNPSDIAKPIRSIVRHQKNIDVILDKALSIDLKTQIVLMREGQMQYDYLILATGATHSYFGHDEWESLAPGLKTIDEALNIRNHIFWAFEEAEKELDPKRKRSLMTFVIVGGGPTGVELAGSLAEISRYTLKRDFRNIDPSKAKINLIEGHPHILPSYPEDLSIKAKRQLERLGVTVRTDSLVTKITRDAVFMGDEEIPSKTVLWAAGVKASSISKSLHVPLDKNGRIYVDPELTIPGFKNVFVAGDLVALKQDNQWIPGVAPAAVQEGIHCARNIINSHQGKKLKTFYYKDKGSLATIGRAAAVAHFRRFKLSGFLAWIMWLFVHIFYLIGFRNRVLVLFQWAWSYLTYQRGSRLITKQKN